MSQSNTILYVPHSYSERRNAVIQTLTSLNSIEAHHQEAIDAFNRTIATLAARGLETTYMTPYGSSTTSDEKQQEEYKSNANIESDSDSDDDVPGLEPYVEHLD